MLKTQRQLVLRAACMHVVLFSACAQHVGGIDDTGATSDNGVARAAPDGAVGAELPTGSTMSARRGHVDSSAAEAGAPAPANDAGATKLVDAGSATKLADAGSATKPTADGGGTGDAGIDAVRTRDAATIALEASTTGRTDAAVRADAGDTGIPTAAAWRPFNDVSPWNTPIANSATVDPASATMIADLTSQPNTDPLWLNIQEYSVPVYWVDSKATPMVKVTADVASTGFRVSGSSDSVADGSGMSPIPAGAAPALGTDRHLAIVDRSTMTEWGLWDADHASSGWTAGLAATMDLKGTGVRPPERSAPWWAGHGARACGFPLIAGLITPEEIRAGRIEHALVMAYPHIRSRYYTSPASSAQGAFMEATPDRGILCGGHVQLDPTLNLATLGLSNAGLAIATALQKYGAFVGDYSGAKSIYADASPTAQAYWATGVLSNDAVSRIPLNRLRVLTIGTTYDNGN